MEFWSQISVCFTTHSQEVEHGALWRNTAGRDHLQSHITARRPSWPIPVTPKQRNENRPPLSPVMYSCAEGNCNRQREKTGVQGGSTQLMKAADRRSEGTGEEGTSTGERGLVMDGVEECQTCSERLRAILSVPKWQKQMAEIELGSHCYELPDSDAFQVSEASLGGFRRPG